MREFATGTKICPFYSFLTLLIRISPLVCRLNPGKSLLQEQDSDEPIAPFLRVTVFLLRRQMAVFLQRPINPGGKSLMTALFLENFDLIMLQYLGNQMPEFQELNAMAVVCLRTTAFKTFVLAKHWQICTVY